MTERSGRRRRLSLPRTIPGLVLVVAAASALITAALGGLTYWFVHEEIERQIDHRVDIETRALLEYEREHGFDALIEAVRIRDLASKPGTVGYLDDEPGDDERSMGYAVVDAAGHRRAGRLDARMPPPGWSEFVPFVRPDGTPAIAQGINARLSNGGRLLVAADRTIVDRMDFVLLRLFIAAVALLMLASVGTTLAFGVTIRRRLRAMESRASAIMAGDMTQRMPVHGGADELDGLATVLNRMLDRISTLLSNLREVSSGLAHDLRTPLSRVSAKLEKAAALATDPAQRDLLDAASDDTDELIGLFASLLAITEIDGKLVRKRFVPVDVADAVREIAEAHRPSLEDAGLRLELSIEPATVHGDKALIQRIVANLLDNALVHAHPGRSVSVTSLTEGRETVIRVADDGPGVPLKDQPRIFERLVRLDTNRGSPGHGLGLSMVQAIAAAHDGTARIVAGPPGMVVEIRLPAGDDDDAEV
ncbi:HAMP domain-containing sensor histidine kinase [Novosphingobium resinovorum]|uniref:histidine kinase n=1 Tax=Novosphingobium resinovorum TaxID=158500 RepID=A0A031J9R4_9SPHN|nr:MULTISPECIES: HAMP domain-containing sensor histidine kinase [Novosphingobium]EZP70904.1 Sensory transduction histidine kinase [Novosphingobium resinovorum]MBF7013456.1 HAMP domain-containing histidine kinase [Novosphingobium sp. HR1a]WJM25604.1 HAMP domain-containing sensor histidine kinase [Novosphingobium resinovorum]